MSVTRDDVWLCLSLYEQRREPELRAARAWMTEFSPKSIRDFRKVWDGSAGADANRYWRQAGSYWEMISALLVSGAISQEAVGLFEKTTREFFLVYAKLAPFLDQIRKETRPSAFSALEALCRSRPDFEEAMAHYTRMNALIEKRTKRARGSRPAKRARPAARPAKAKRKARRSAR